ncbi:uncharacterized protein N7483_006808 [Penicillium malachiteum]|uniref:uncharacterized protein n=1 Tax=Penicillium malachiteum TaxID=1324776 RepID=UPI002547DF4D|nr:uncharacterized protein N7483_006808 [Penicillium malachiteum]KAJ5725451.1 hypothetical protein N7483_006808 [Penicillium malachiteum]
MSTRTSHSKTSLDGNDSPGKDQKDSWVEDTHPTDSYNPLSIYRSYDPEFRAKTERELRHKIDTRILPLIVLIYLFNYLDRNSITQARLYGLQEDTGLQGAEYQTAISIFSAGYIVMQLPSTVMMTKFRPSIYLPTCIVLWAFVSGCTAATFNTPGILMVRFFLGFVEAPLFPGAVYYLSAWYTKREIGVRMALLICGILLSNAFAGLISAGILSGMGGVAGLTAWKWLFILEDLATMLLGVVSFFTLPDFPGTTKWLTDAERIVAQARLAIDAGNDTILDPEEVSLTRGSILAVKDVRTWIFACMQMSTTASISYSHFFPSLIKQLGFQNSTIVLLLSSPPYFVAFIWALSWAWFSDRKQTRSIPSGISQITAMVGTILLIAVTDQLWARYAFTILVCCGTFGVYSTTYAWLSSTLTQPPIKRAVAIGLANTCANWASLFANYFWLDQYKPEYRESWGCLLAFQALGMTCILTLRYILQYTNRKFERLAVEIDLNDTNAILHLNEDERNAVQNNFRYVI